MFWSWMAVTIVIAASILVPFMFPSLMLMTLVADSVLISFVTGWRLWSMLAVNLVAISLIVAVGVLSPPEPGLSLWAERILVLATIPIATGLIVLVLAQFAGRLRAANEQLERRASEKAQQLLRTEARMSALIASAMDGIVTMDDEGRIVEWNGAAERMFGKPWSDMAGADVSELIIFPPPCGEDDQREFGDRLVTGQGSMLERPVELTALRADGSEFAVEACVTKVEGHGATPMFTAFIRDITERKRADAALRESEQRFLQFAEQLPLGIYVVDTDGRPTFMNAAAKATLGVVGELRPPPGEFVATGRGFIEGTDRPYPKEGSPTARALTGERNVRADDVEIRLPDRTIPLEVVANPILDSAGRVVFAIAALIDLSFHKEAEAKLRQAAVELEGARQQADAANRAKSDFLSRMSHELRTPLTAILGFAQLLEVEDLSQQQRESVGYVVRAGKHLLGLINEVLDIAQVESGHISLSIEPVALAEVVHEMVELMGPSAARRNIDLEVARIDEEATDVLADRQRLKQVLLNLVSNAIKYNRPGGSVRLSVSSATAGTFRIAVTDTGPGIPDAGLGRLFTAFDRVGAERTEVEGTGLGLSLAKALVEAMGGGIGVETMVGGGSTFWFELPRVPCEDGQAEAASRALDDAVAGQQGSSAADGWAQRPTPVNTVLYIEDNRSNLALLELLLTRRPGIDLLSAVRGGAGIALARQRRPDLILLDLHLPDMHGDRVLADLRSHSSTGQIPVVVLSGDATPGLAERLREAGATDYMAKPLDLTELLAIIDRYAGAGPEKE